MSTDHYLSHKAIKKAVVEHSLSHPFTMYPVIGGILGIAGTAVLAPSIAGFAAASAVLLFGAGHGASKILFGAEAIERQMYQKHQKLMEAKQQELLDHLSQDLSEAGCTEGSRQLEKLNEKFSNFSSLLSRKLKPGNSPTPAT